VTLTHVPTRQRPALTDLIAAMCGLFQLAAAAVQLVKEGKVRPA